ncbi:MAG: hypothetical protein KGL39_37010 [Patescibacteria group bacterium]|nr:hypothetical protein [Patescibacteria group bacterium]
MAGKGVSPRRAEPTPNVRDTVFYRALGDGLMTGFPPLMPEPVRRQPLNGSEVFDLGNDMDFMRGLQGALNGGESSRKC